MEYTPSLEPAETMEDGMAVLEPVSVACTGDLAETAKNAPMDGDRIRKQLMKTGDCLLYTSGAWGRDLLDSLLYRDGPDGVSQPHGLFRCQGGGGHRSGDHFCV